MLMLATTAIIFNKWFFLNSGISIKNVKATVIGIHHFERFAFRVDYD